MPHRRNTLLRLPCPILIVVALATFSEQSVAVEEQAAKPQTDFGRQYVIEGVRWAVEK